MDKQQFIMELDAIGKVMEQISQRIYSLKEQADHFYDSPPPTGDLQDNGTSRNKVEEILNKRKKLFKKI